MNATELADAGLIFHMRHDTERRSQLIANLDDIIQAFVVLDSPGLIPDIFCEANDLLHMPTLSLDPTAELIQENTKTLHSPSSKIEDLEKHIASSQSSSHNQICHSYAAVASSAPSASEFSNTGRPTRVPSSTSPVSNSRYSNLILFGLPESKSIVQLKLEVDELLEFLAESSVKVEDVFREIFLILFSSTPCLNLSSAWDRRIILLHKRNLKGFRIPRLFLHEDVPPEHKLRKRGALVQNKGSPIALPTSPTHQPPLPHTSSCSSSPVRSNSHSSSTGTVLQGVSDMP